MDQPPTRQPDHAATDAGRPPSPPAAPATVPPLLTHADLFHTVWQQAADAMVLSDASGIVLAANPAYLRLYGYGEAAVVGHSFAIIFPPEQRAWAVDQYQQVFASASIVPAYKSVIRRADGTERVVEARIEFLSANGQRVAMLSTLRDITERKQAEAERERLLAETDQARGAAEAALAVRDRFLSIAAHEVRTPLTSILGYADVLQRKSQAGAVPAAQQTRMLGLIYRQAKRLSLLMEQVFDVTRIEQGQFDLERHPLDLGALVGRVTDEFRLGLAADDTAPTIELRATAEELIVAGDADRLEQVLLNLLSNAVKYSPSGRPIVVRVARDGTQAVLEVADQGIGIPDAAQAHLFESFYRAGNVGPISGLGIGLHVVATIVARHDGRIEVESTEGAGSTFRVSLPLVEPTA